MKICDLHTHSTASDGADSPEEIIDLAIKAGLNAICLTDHNNVEGLKRFFDAAKGKDIIAIGGCEFSTDYFGTELHLIGMFLKEDKFDQIREYVDSFAKAKVQANIDTIQRMKDAGMPVDPDEFKKTIRSAVTNRMHIARYLMKKGIVITREQAFKEYLQDGGPYYYSSDKPDFIKTIDFIHSVGGVAVWAHPLFHVTKNKCKEILKNSPQLDGMECYYTTYSEEETKWSVKTCEKFGIVASGGSDYHGINKPDTFLAIGHGNLIIPYSCYEKLLERKNNY
ncbi:MAG: PHP domain-containing protein [Bacilli bacterium]|nr:PHP domain-containing protein [Bacilli bacterium]